MPLVGPRGRPSELLNVILNLPSPSFPDREKIMTFLSLLEQDGRGLEVEGAFQAHPWNTTFHGFHVVELSGNDTLNQWISFIINELGHCQKPEAWVKSVLYPKRILFSSRS